MTTTPWVFDIGRLALILAVIAQAIVFSAHVAKVHANPRYYASALIALPTLTVSWWYFARPPSERTERPTFVWLAYAFTVVAFQALVFGGTDITTHGSTLLYIANAFTPALFLVCIVTGCEKCVKDAEFIMASGVAILNAFDVTDAILAVSRNGQTVSVNFRGALMAIACLLLVWSALEFTIRSQMTHDRMLPRNVSVGLHAVHMALNASMFGLRAVLYAKGMIEFSTMIAKNAMVFSVRFVYMLSTIWVPSIPPPQMTFSVVPSAPPPLPKLVENGCASMQPPRPALRVENNTTPKQNESLLYPVLPKHVHFKDDTSEE